MAQKNMMTKSRAFSNGASGKNANGRSGKKTKVSKSNRNGSELTANELTLRAWKHLYAKRDRFGKL